MLTQEKGYTECNNGSKKKKLLYKDKSVLNS